MTKTTVVAHPLPHLPWQDRLAASGEVVWRYSANPIIPRNAIPTSNSIFNSAVVPFKEGFAGVFRCDNKARTMNIHRGFSRDAIHWEIDPGPIEFAGDPDVTKFEYRYDPRVIWIEDRYYVSWCNGHHGPRLAGGHLRL
jgi:beta-1,4-mannooligosaccharide/beta-1,4-mannosyl-N-acetylglucosamine phosphorylase